MSPFVSCERDIVEMTIIFKKYCCGINNIKWETNVKFYPEKMTVIVIWVFSLTRSNVYISML